MKCLYEIIINNSPKRCQKYYYNYGNTKNIELSISAKGILIKIWLSKKKTIEEIISSKNHMFLDALKKAMLVYLIKYSKNLLQKNIVVRLDNEIYKIEKFPKFYCLVEKSLYSKMHCGWAEQKIIEDVLWFTASAERERMASLYALLVAKSKKYESEKFLYLWMAFNGMYGYFSKLVERANWQEWQQLVMFQDFNGWGRKTFNNEQKKRLFLKTKTLLTHYENNLNKNFFQSVDGIILDRDVQNLLKSETKEEINLSTYGFLLTQFAYWMRCNLFHANRPTMFFVFDEDKDLKHIRQINSLLEEYIDETLYKWFDKDYRDNYLKLKSQEVTRPKKQKKEK